MFCCGMERNANPDRSQIREEVVRQLEQFPVEVLEAVLMILQPDDNHSEYGT